MLTVMNMLTLGGVYPESRVTMNAWSEEVIDAEDMHRRCAAHHGFLANSPDVVAFAQDWADRNLDALAQR
jgi:hypothetical protein